MADTVERVGGAGTIGAWPLDTNHGAGLEQVEARVSLDEDLAAGPVTRNRLVTQQPAIVGGAFEHALEPAGIGTASIRPGRTGGRFVRGPGEGSLSGRDVEV